MSLADIAGGANKAILRILVARELEKRRAITDELARMRGVREQLEFESRDQERQFNRERLGRLDERQGRLDEEAATEKRSVQGGRLADALPPGLFLTPRDPAVPTMQEGGYASLLQPSERETGPAMGPEFTGPMPGDESPQEAQVGKQRGFLKTMSQKQRDTETETARHNRQLDISERTAADTAEIRRMTTEIAGRNATRAESAQQETARHNRAMEARPAASSTVVIQGPNGPMVVDKGSRSAAPIKDAQGADVGFSPTAQMRNQETQYAKAKPILEAISTLSEKINTGQGVAAKARGTIEEQKAKINLNDDVAEYDAMISGFTPLIARSLGHSGVLTEQDVQSVKAMFPRPGDSKSLRDRKVARILQLMGSIEGAAGGATPAKAGGFTVEEIP